jgi:cell division protein FtsB
MQWLRRYFLVIILALIFLLLQYELWFSHGGIFQNRRLQQQLATERALVQQQQAENKRLVAEVMKIKNDPQQIEAHARDDLGMVKKGEEYIEIAVQPNSHEPLIQQNEGLFSDENIAQ